MQTRNTVARFMEVDPLLVSPDDTLRAAAGAMVERSVGAAVVGAARHPVGLVSERDLIGAVAQGLDLDHTPVARVMTEFVIDARPEDPVLEAVLTMLDRHVRHLAVSDGGKVVGMVSIRDLMRPLIGQALVGDDVAVAAGPSR